MILNMIWYLQKEYILCYILNDNDYNDDYYNDDNDIDVAVDNVLFKAIFYILQIGTIYIYLPLQYPYI